MSTIKFHERLTASRRIHIKQIYEISEILIGWESRNKYQILDENNAFLAYAAEKSQGFRGALMRGMLKHWRRFDIVVFNESREKMFNLHFPFRWFFKTLIVQDHEGLHIGTLQQRWAFFYKKFDILDKNGRVVCRIRSPFFKIWTFEFKRATKKIGTLQKKWSGLASEMFTDRDNFTLSFADPSLEEETKLMMMSMALLVDIIYFENNQGSKSFFGN